MVMAFIYTKCGQYDKALDELETLLIEPTNYSVNDLRLNRELEPLRKLTRFKEMLQKYPVASGSS